MIDTRLAFLCPSFHPYWVQIFDLLDNQLGENFTVVTQSVHSAGNAEIAQSMGRFRRKVVMGRRLSISDRKSELGRGTPFGLNIAPTLPLTLLRLRPQVVISSNFGLWTLAALIMKYPTVIFWEGTHHTERTVGDWRHRLRKWMGRRAGSFVVNGTAARAYLHERLGVDNRRIFIGSLCAEKPPLNFRSAARIRSAPDAEINFLFVGRLIKGKGVDHLLYAAKSLQQAGGRRSNFRLTIVGGGPERLAVEKLAEQLGIGDRVRFTGQAHPASVWQHYLDGDVFVLPTLHDNWPLVALEAMSMGLPVLLSNHAGSQPDVVHHDQNGFGFNPSDHDELAALMARYLLDPDLVRRHGDYSLVISDSFRPERAVQAFIEASEAAIDHLAPSKG